MRTTKPDYLKQYSKWQKTCFRSIQLATKGNNYNEKTYQRACKTFRELWSRGCDLNTIIKRMEKFAR